MIENHGSKRTLMCNDCDDIYDQVSAEEFGQMIAGAKQEGWKIAKDEDGEWEHRCPRCRTGTGLDAQRRLLGL